MSGQLSYSYQTPKGVAGSLIDLSPHSIDSRVNGESSAKTMRFGMGVVRGDNPGTDVLVPNNDSENSQFEGLVLTGFTNQMDMGGKVIISPLQTVGVLRWGKAWARVANGIAPAYGEPLYVIKSGDDAGLFTNIATDNLAVNGKFIGSLGTGDIAPVEIYNQKA